MHVTLCLILAQTFLAPMAPFCLYIMSLPPISNFVSRFFPHMPSNSARLARFVFPCSVVPHICAPTDEVSCAWIPSPSHLYSSKSYPIFRAQVKIDLLCEVCSDISGSINPSLACVCLALCTSHGLLCVPPSRLGPKLLESGCLGNFHVHLP